MILSRMSEVCFSRKSAASAVYAVLLYVSVTTAPLAQTASPDGMAEYLNHLSQLQGVVTGCQKQRAPDTCNASRVGGDDRVRLTIGGKPVEREIRYNWLRVLLARAGGNDGSQTVTLGAAPIVHHPAPSVDSLLQEAQKRLAYDAEQASGASASEASYAKERMSLATILQRPEYLTVTKTTLRERLLEWLGNWLDRIVGKLVGIGSRVPWLARLLRGLLLTAMVLMLAWILIRIERKARVRLVSDTPLSTDTPSAREWGLWLADARSMAAQGAWREAIHFLYWAVISRLESRSVWTADRTRTPREYLRLFPSNDPHKGQLTSLTRSFEQTWYGGRPAAPEDYDFALRLAEELGVK